MILFGFKLKNVSGFSCSGKVILAVNILEEQPFEHTAGVFVCSGESHSAYLFPLLLDVFVHVMPAVYDDADILLSFSFDDAIHQCFFT